MKTIWLFTYSDFKTIVIPSTIFGLLGFLCGPPLLPTPPLLASILSRLLPTAIWVWINLLPSLIGNQRTPSAILEDSQNKPWRPLPSNRLSPSQAKSLMLACYAAALLASLYLGGLRSCLMLMCLAYCYNDSGVADRSCVVKNLINAFGYLAFVLGAIEVAASMPNVTLTGRAWCWFGVIGAVVFSTVQMQDLQDQGGDRARGRKTVPIVFGDTVGRWSVAVAVAGWSLVAPAFWKAGIGGWVGPIGVGGIVVGRVLRLKEVKDDRATFKIWNLWMVCLYTIPLISRIK